jgi:HK97 family phage portal protein
MKKVIDALYDSYAKLIAYSIQAYKKSRGTRGIFKVDSIPKAGTTEFEAYQDLIGKKFRQFMEAPDAILPLGSGQNYEDLSAKTYSNESTRDIRALIDDISDFTAKGFGIPPALLRGDIQGTKDAVDNLLTFCIDPLVDTLQEEIVRKRIGKTEYLKGTKLVIDTRTIKHIDLFDIDTAIDKLVSSGCFSVNDIRRATGDEPINEDWADQYFMTKNYTSIEELLNESLSERSD